jgi:hypothetical protein
VLVLEFQRSRPVATALVAPGSVVWQAVGYSFVSTRACEWLSNDFLVLLVVFERLRREFSVEALGSVMWQIIR